ncbi:MAG: hypothetical protein IJ454_00930 [Clostridia bacterium]|nr:hypothetical protein [Clostridia bacterium]
MKKILCIIIAVILTAGCGREQIYIPDKQPAIEDMNFITPRLNYGRAHITELPGGKAVLIGCGGSEDFPVLYEILRRREIERLDIIILTSSLSSASGGFEKVISNFDVGDIYVSSKMDNIGYYQRICRDTLGDETNFYIACEGTEIYNEDKVSIDIISDRICETDGVKKAAMTIYISHGDTNFLIEGDCDYSAERDMLATMPDFIESEVLVVPRCGSSYLPSDELLEAVKAKYAVIPAYYDLSPTRTMLKRLRERQIEVFRTDTEGTIILSSDGKNITGVYTSH